MNINDLLCYQCKEIFLKDGEGKTGIKGEEIISLVGLFLESLNKIMAVKLSKCRWKTGEKQNYLW